MTGDQWEILATAATSAVVVGVLGLGAGWLLRRRSIRWQLTLVAVVAVSAVLVGVLAIAQRMFISDHDFEVVTLVTVAAAVVALLVAAALGMALTRWSRSLRTRYAGSARPAPAPAPAGVADRASSKSCRPSSPRPRPGWRSRGPARPGSRGRDASWSRGSPTTCAPRWPGCAR